MKFATVLELARQLLRLVGLYLASVGLPDEYVKWLGDPTTVNLVAGFISYSTAETGWLVVKYKQFMKWFRKGK